MTAGRGTPSAGREADVLRVWRLSNASAGAPSANLIGLALLPCQTSMLTSLLPLTNIVMVMGASSKHIGADAWRHPMAEAPFHRFPLSWMSHPDTAFVAPSHRTLPARVVGWTYQVLMSHTWPLTLFYKPIVPLHTSAQALDLPCRRRAVCGPRGASDRALPAARCRAAAAAPGCVLRRLGRVPRLGRRQRRARAALRQAGQRRLRAAAAAALSCPQLPARCPMASNISF